MLPDPLFLALAALPTTRLLVVVAHPDDEVLGCGILITRAAHVRVVHVTDGAPRNGADAHRQGLGPRSDYAAVRRAEALAALALAGLPPERLDGLGVADQDASLHLATVARRLVPCMQNCDLVLTHAYEGGHADHDAVAYAVQAAHRLSRGTSILAEMPFYHGDATGWVRQTWLPHPAAGPEHEVALTAAERDLKARMVAAHATQAETLRSFALDVERVRVAPPYRFDRLPHAGPLLYERHGWNLTGSQWLARVAAADTDLGLGPA